MYVSILNQFRGHWLLNDTLDSTISMSLKFIDKIEIVTFYNNLMDEDENIVSENSHKAQCAPPPLQKGFTWLFRKQFPLISSG
jgi:hypothetical protein